MTRNQMVQQGTGKDQERR